MDVDEVGVGWFWLCWVFLWSVWDDWVWWWVELWGRLCEVWSVDYFFLFCVV